DDLRQDPSRSIWYSRILRRPDTNWEGVRHHLDLGLATPLETALLTERPYYERSPWRMREHPSISTKSFRIQQFNIQHRLLPIENLRDQRPSDRTETKSHHRMSGGDAEIREALRAPDVGKPVRRAGTQTAPGLDLFEMLGLKLRIIGRDRFDDPLHA